MKVPCPECGQTLSLPDRFAGKQTKCPACLKSFLAPGESDLAQAVESASKTKAPVAPPDDMALAALMAKKEEEPAKHTEDALDVCPGCGAKWKKGASTCGKCYYNIYAARRVRPPSRGKLIPDVNVTRIFLYALVVGAVYGGYWLYNNYTDVKRKGSRMYDDASRSNINADDGAVMIRKDSRAQDKDKEKK